MDTSSSKNTRRFNKSDVLTIAIAHFIHDIYTSFLAPLQTLIIQQFGINHSLFGLLSVFQRIPSLFNPIVGILAEKFKARYFLILAPLVTAISMSLIGIATGYVFLVIIMVVSGTSSVFFHIPTPVMIKQVSGTQTGKGMSYYMVGGELARTIGPLIITAAVDIFGFHGTFNLIPMGLLASMILYVRFRNKAINQTIKRDEKLVEFRQTFKKHLPVFLLVFGLLFTRGTMKSSMTYYLPRYMDLSGSSVWISSIALSVVQLFGALGVFLSGNLSDRIGKRKTFLIISIISPILMWLFILFEGENILTFSLLAINGLFLLALTPVMLSLIVNLENKHVSFLNGIFMTGNLFISSVMTVCVGLGFDLIGHEISFKIAGSIAFLAIPLSIIFSSYSENRK